MKNNIITPIKWAGCKRTQADEGFPECNGWTKITNDTGTSKFRRQMSKTREPNKVLKTKESLYVKLK